jgi:chemotaxis protein methyltransferase CheR
VNERECVRFLQWALPQLRLRWPGFRRVRRQVCRRVARRVAELGLTDLQAYQQHLVREASEWSVLDGLCHITISRFYRDRGLFDHLRDEVLPAFAARAAADGGTRPIRCWSAGCASGEEAYTVALIWRLAVARTAPGVRLEVIGTDVEPALLERARRACYPASSLRELPGEWVTRAFERRDSHQCLRPALREGVSFLEQDLRRESPGGGFHTVLCRNLAFTYFDAETQQAVLARLRDCLLPGGVLVIGSHESLPACHDLQRLSASEPLYCRSDAP